MSCVETVGTTLSDKSQGANQFHAKKAPAGVSGAEQWSCLVNFGDWSLLEFDGFSDKRKLVAWDRLNDQLAPRCGAFMILAPLRDGKRQLRFQCLECDGLENP